MNRFALLLPLALLLASPVSAHNGVDDEPHHGGVVRPHKDLHLETAVLPAGGLQIYFSDAMGEPLPASAVSQVAVEIDHPGARTDAIDMAIDPTGVFWTGKSLPLTDAKSVVRVGFSFNGAQGLVEMPGTALIAAAKKGPPKKTASAKPAEKPHGH
jgi:hypothetical protein